MRRTLDRRCLAAIVLGLLTALQAALSVRAEETNFVRIEHNRPDGAIVGERVSLSVQILTDTWLSQAATITVPEVPGLILLKVSAFGVNGTERVGADTYTTQAHEYAVFARRSGRFVIPAFRLRFGVAGQPVGTKVLVDRETEPIELVAAMPPGVEELDGLISTPDLVAVETWDPDPGDGLSVGDAIRRSILYRAEGVMGMAFPPTRFEPIEGLGVYPHPPELDDQTQRGDFTGSRTDAVTYVFERAGAFVISEISVAWWDLDEGVLKKTVLPSRQVEVSPGLSAASVVAEQSPGTGGFMWIGLSGVLAVSGLAFLPPIRRWGRNLVRRLRTYREEHSVFGLFLDSCAQSDSRRAYRFLRDWHSLVMPGRILSASASEFSDPSLIVVIRELEQAALGSNGTWAGGNAAELVTRWRRVLKRSRSRRPVEGLPPLNP